MLLFKYRGDDMSRRSNQNNQYNGNQYNGNQYYGNNNQYYNQNGQYYNQNGQYYNQNGQYYNQNGQYYGRNNQMPQKQPKSNKFGILGPQNTNTSNQKKTTKDNSLLIKIGIFAVFAIILLIIVFSINSCGKKSEPACAEDYRQVGTEKYGYYCIPSDWVKFENENPIRGIQYSDINGEYILTLDSVATSEISAKDYALATANSFQNAGIVAQGAEVELDKYKAYQVYGQTDGGIWLLVYFFEADDGYSHYVGVEGPDKTNEAFKIVESFTTEKEE